MAGWEIDWSSAEVKDANLRVQVSGEDDGAEEWSQRVQSVLRVLDRAGGKWGEIKVSKGKIEVADLREGYEPDLRHLLESAALQANTDLAAQEDDDDDDDEGDDEADDDDQKMADAFRSFAADSEDGESDENRDKGEKSDKKDKPDKKDKGDKGDKGE